MQENEARLLPHTVLKKSPKNTTAKTIKLLEENINVKFFRYEIKSRTLTQRQTK
jgi:hypothetical protein